MANMKAFFNVACSGVLVCFELKKLKYLQYKVLTRDCTERLVIKWSECFCNSASQIWIVNYYFFQSVPIVVDSHCDRDNFHIHFCCNFTQTVLFHPKLNSIKIP